MNLAHVDPHRRRAARPARRRGRGRRPQGRPAARPRRHLVLRRRCSCSASPPRSWSRSGRRRARRSAGSSSAISSPTSWVAARRRDGTTGRFEIIACAAALGAGRADGLGRLHRRRRRPRAAARSSPSPALCLLAGLLDLNAILRASSRPRSGSARHLWRMCFAFFIATGSFFLGQQDVLPAAVRGSPILFVLAFAPFARDGLLAGAGALRESDSRRLASPAAVRAALEMEI